MNILTWNKLWSQTEKEQQASLARATSIHPGTRFGYSRTARHKEKNRVSKAKNR